MQVAVILPAAGLGSRFAAGGRASASKLEYELDHKPVFLHAVEAFRQHVDVGQIILAVPPDRLDDFLLRWGDKLSYLKVELVAGGRRERWETVRQALSHVGPDATHIAVHDAARPLVSAALIDRVFAAAAKLSAVVPGLPASDTLKRATPPEECVIGSDVEADPLDAILGEASSPIADVRRIEATVERKNVMAVQTPQVFAADLLRRAYARVDAALHDDGVAITDDAGLVEALGEPVYIVPGDAANLKLTHPADAELLEALLHHRRGHAAKAKVVDLFGDDD